MKPLSAAGERLVGAAASLIPAFRERAALADANGEMAEENYADLHDAGIRAAFVPEALGGAGLSSVHDWLLLIATLARGDGSTAIAINMHLGVTRGMAAAYQRALAEGRDGAAAEAPLRAVADGRMLICATATERGSDNLHPQTTAVKTDDGWCIDGHKLFVTLSPIATHLAMNLKMQDDRGTHIATTLLPIDSPGLHPQGDWQALGMRGSGSQSVKFEGVRVAERSVRRLGPWGQWSTEMLINRTLGNLPLVAAFLGIAEHAHELALKSLKTQQRNGDMVKASAGVQQMVGEMEIELRTCRAVLQTAGRDTDAWLQAHAASAPTQAQAHELMQSYQAAKWVINRGAINIVDRAMDLCGGGAFMQGHELSRLYRDVRAGPFMQPHAPPDIRLYVGQVALEEYPSS